MKKVVFLVLIVLLLFAYTGCATGPKKLSRKWDDYVNQAYVDSPWLTWALSDVIPAYPIVGLFAGLGDVLFLNPYYFWGFDAWDGEGTAFMHENPTAAKYEK